MTCRPVYPSGTPFASFPSRPRSGVRTKEEIMRRSFRLLPVLGLAVMATGLLAGCPQDQVHFHDDLDMVFDFKPFDPLILAQEIAAM